MEKRADEKQNIASMKKITQQDTQHRKRGEGKEREKKYFQFITI